MTSFVDTLKQLSTQDITNEDVEAKRKSIFLRKWDAIYTHSIQIELERVALSQKKEAYMNFDREHFVKTGLGRPGDTLEMFLTALSDSTLLPDGVYPGMLKDITFEVWNNPKFTVRFSWDD